MAASNTKECMLELVGHQVIGVLIGAFPLHNQSIAKGTRSFILDDGRAFTFNTNGAFWIESADDVRRAVEKRQQELQEAMVAYEAVLAMSGATGRPSAGQASGNGGDG